MALPRIIRRRNINAASNNYALFADSALRRRGAARPRLDQLRPGARALPVEGGLTEEQNRCAGRRTGRTPDRPAPVMAMVDRKIIEMRDATRHEPPSAENTADIRKLRGGGGQRGSPSSRPAAEITTAGDGEQEAKAAGGSLSCQVNHN